MKLINLTSLERLDLVDMNALQDNMKAYIAHTLGLMDTGACILPPTITVDQAGEYLSFSDFSFLAVGYEGTGSLPSITMGKEATNKKKVGYLAHFDPALANTYSPSPDAGVGLDFDGYKTSVTAYYADNATLPPRPDEAGYSLVTHGQYYPNIWARIRMVNVSGNRAFWSVAQTQEVTSDGVTVAKQPLVEISFYHAGQYPASTDEYVYAKIGQIVKWGAPEGLVTLSPTEGEVRPFTWVESAMELSLAEYSLPTPTSYHGIGAALRHIKEAITALANTGAEDPAIPTGHPWTWGSAPKYSLLGVGQTVDNLTSSLNARFHLRSSITFTVYINPSNVGQGRAVTLSTIVHALSDVAPSMVFDYTRVLTAKGVATIDIPNNTPPLNTQELHRAHEDIVLFFTNAENNRLVRNLSITQAADDTHSTYTPGSLADTIDHNIFPVIPVVSSRISALTVKSWVPLVENTVYGLRIRLANLDSLLATSGTPKKVSFRVDLEIDP